MIDLDSIFDDDGPAVTLADGSPSSPGCPVGDAARPDGPRVGPDRLAGCGVALDGDADGLPVKLDMDAVDGLAVAVGVGDVPGWRYPKPAAALDGVPVGWTADGWRRRLRYMADCCQELHPARAAELHGMADGLTLH